MMKVKMTGRMPNRGRRKRDQIDGGASLEERVALFPWEMSEDDLKRLASAETAAEAKAFDVEASASQ